MLARVNSFRSDPTGHLGALAMLGFAVIAGWRWTQTGLLFFLMLVIRDIAAAWFLCSRKPAMTGTDLRNTSTGIAYVSTAMPLLYATASGLQSPLLVILGELLPILGFAIATTALLDLSDSFGLSPANRGVVQVGIYRYVRHPMYFGYVIAEIGMVVANKSNAALFLGSTCLYLTRGRMESRVIRA